MYRFVWRTFGITNAIIYLLVIVIRSYRYVQSYIEWSMEDLMVLSVWLSLTILMFILYKRLSPKRIGRIKGRKALILAAWYDWVLWALALGYLGLSVSFIIAISDSIATDFTEVFDYFLNSLLLAAFVMNLSIITLLVYWIRLLRGVGKVERDVSSEILDEDMI